MRICVWRTNHPIADTVAAAVYYGLGCHTYETISGPILTSKIENIDRYDIHIGYGILRGMDEVFRECDRQGKPWFNIDKGYWKPGHYDGYYRISLRGTQQTGGWPAPDYERWEALRLGVEEPPASMCNRVIICPPTDYVCNWLGIKENDWILDASHKAYSEKPDNFHAIVRRKEDDWPIDWRLLGKVITFNSSVGWEALRRGIPVESDPLHSIVGAWAKNYRHILMESRRELFATQAAMQLTLDEMRQGQLYPLMQKLLDADNLNKA